MLSGELCQGSAVVSHTIAEFVTVNRPRRCRDDCLDIGRQSVPLGLVDEQIKGSRRLLKELALLSDKVLKEHASKDQLSEEILNSITEFRKNAVGLAAVQMQPYLAARSAVV